MATDTALIRLTGKRQLVGTDGVGHSIVMDAKEQYGGEGTGIRPVELILHGLAGCTAMDVISILEKKRQDVRGIEIAVTAEQRTEEYPKIYTNIHLEYIVTGFDVEPEAVRRAIELSEEKYCSVKGMLRDEIVVETSFRVEEARPANVALFEQKSQD